MPCAPLVPVRLAWSAAVLAAGFCEDPYPLSVAALTFSAGYFLVDLFCCLRERDWMFAGHHAATLVLVGACLREPEETLVLGARALLVELSTPLLHHWQKRDTAATFALFLAAFFAAHHAGRRARPFCGHRTGRSARRRACDALQGRAALAAHVSAVVCDTAGG